MNESLPPPKTSKPKWLWISIAALSFLCMAGCAAGLLVTWFNASRNAGRAAGVEKADLQGTLAGTRYTAPQGNFSCDFSSTRADMDTLGDDDNSVWASNNIGGLFFIDYAPIKDDKKYLFEDDTTKQNTLESVANNQLVPGWEKDYPGTRVLHSTFLNSDMYFIFVHVPGGSRVATNGAGEPLDSYRGLYIFAENDWLYFVQYDKTNILSPNEAVEISEIQLPLADLYRECEFK